jgi:putative hydrolase of the HAD superfamily
MPLCAFCRKPSEQLGRFVSDPDEPICSDCIQACVDLLGGEPREGWVLTATPKRCAYCGRRPSEGVRHCTNLATRSQRICERCVHFAVEALEMDLPTVEEQIRRLIEEDLHEPAGTSDTDLKEDTFGAPSDAPAGPLRRPHAVLFDFGGTLVRLRDFDRAAGVEAVLDLADPPCRGMVPAVLEIVDELDVEIQERREASMLESPVSVRNRLIYDRLGITFRTGPDDLERAFWEAAFTYELEPGVVPALDDLQARDIPMAVMSNSAFSGARLLGELGRRGLSGFFSFAVTSADYGLRKPHPLIFQTAMQRLGVSTADAWYVGNSRYYDVEGARKAGMGAVWYNPRERQPQGPRANASVANWAEFLRVVAEASGE